MKKRCRRPLICLIGIDGSGKTTHALNLYRKLSAMNYSCTYIRPRYALAQLVPMVRNWTEGRFYPCLKPLTIPHKTVSSPKRALIIVRAPFLCLLLVYALATHFLVIRPLLRKSIVVCDRYFLDWFYNNHWGTSIALVQLLPIPDLVLFLDVPITIAFSRMRSPIDANISPEYYESLRRWYMDLTRRFKFITVDSTRDFQSTSNAIFDDVIAFLKDDGISG